MTFIYLERINGSVCSPDGQLSSHSFIDYPETTPLPILTSCILACLALSGTKGVRIHESRLVRIKVKERGGNRVISRNEDWAMTKGQRRF